ncbi:MAG: RlmE family RNA methyltransferase, partial [Oligoflexia bacterium]|nr:RlmE family RNA methyltransferase [Oligoflexia bacterium]
MSFKVKDHFFHKAKKEKFLARSIYKLEEIDQKFKIISSGHTILDLGYFPGSWTQYALSKINNRGLVVGIDIQEINRTLASNPQVHLLQKSIDEVHSIADFNTSEFTMNSPFDVILSDMAPKTTGIKLVDQEASLLLVQKVFLLLPTLLRQGGHLVVKVFEGQGPQEFFKQQQKARTFQEMHFLRPKATRSCSKEYFVIGKKYQ